MSILEAIILGIIQGISEFLPISSTGHLTLAGRFMGLINPESPERWTAFIAVIQMGTLAAILIYFFRDIIAIVKNFVADNVIHRKAFRVQSVESRLGWLVIIGTIPIVLIGLGFKDIIEGALTKNLLVIASSLILLAVILAIAEKTAKLKNSIEEITIVQSVIIGLAQACALIPGASRSGTTIAGGLFCGLNREAAARFSFLLSIPAVLASGLLEFYHQLEYLTADAFLTLGVATFVSAVSGYLSIDFLLKYLKKNSTFIFIWYRIGLGVIILFLIFFNVIKP